MDRAVNDDGTAVRYDGGAWWHYRPATVDEVVLADFYQSGRFFAGAYTPRPDAAIIDIGAHIGAFAVQAARLAPFGRTVAVEPEPDNLGLLRRNVAANALQDLISIRPVALSGSAGVVTLYRTRETWGHSTCRTAVDASVLVDRIAVPALTLGDLLDGEGLSHIDYLKMNIEGAEYATILSTPVDVLTAIDVMHIECHPVPGHTGEELMQHLAKFGFSTQVLWSSHESGKGWITARRATS